MLVEYFLAYRVYKEGKKYRNVIFFILVFLATYQLGEFVLFLTNGNYIGFRIAYFSTTLLPPLGVLLVQKMTNKNYYYEVFQFVGAFFALLFLIGPKLILDYKIMTYCIKVYSYHPMISKFWGGYYQFSLLFIVGVSLYHFLRNRNTKVVSDLKYVLFPVIFFDFGSLLLARINPVLSNSIASLMCAMALVAAITWGKLSLNCEFKQIFDIAWFQKRRE